MSLHKDIKEELVVALKAKDTLRLNVLRGLLTAFTNEVVAKKKKPDEELTDEDVLAIISKAVKQRKDSIEQFEKGKRGDLAEVEKKELRILEAYLPVQMSREEVEEYVKSRQKELNMALPSLKNKFIGTIMTELKGKTDGGLVREIIDTIFSTDFS